MCVSWGDEWVHIDHCDINTLKAMLKGVIWTMHTPYNALCNLHMICITLLRIQ